MVVFRSTDHHEKFGTLKIRTAKLPEGTADRVDHACGHVYRTETAVGCVVGCAVLLGEHSRQCLHLVTTCEQCEFLRIGCTQMTQALLQDFKCLVPGNLFKITVAPITAGLAH